MRSTFLILACSLMIGSAWHSQAAPCSYTLTPASASVSATSGSNSFAVTVGSSCAWTASSTNDWIHTSNSGTGNGTVGFTFDANADPNSRLGAIAVGNKVFTLSQAAAPLALNVALDNNLVWITSSNYPWSGTNSPAPTFDGIDSAVSGNTAVPNSESWLETTVTGPGELTFWWKVVSDPADALEFYIDGEFQDTILNSVDWSYRIYQIPAGTHTLHWLYWKDDAFNAFPDKAWLDRISYSTNAPISLQIALDTCGVPWSSGGNVNPTYWAGQSNVTHDGISAAQSGAVHTSQESSMQTVVSGVTNVSFWWKVSSQANYDYLEFYTNSVLARRITGEVDWQSNFFRLPSTTNLLSWRFAKTNFNIVSQGQNAGWVDQVKFSNPDSTPPVILYSFSNLVLSASSNCQASLPDLTTTNYFLAEDVCSSITVTQVPAAGTFLPLGTHQLILKAFDAAGNTVSSTNSIVVVDSTPPAIVYAFTNLSLSASSNCQAVLPGLTSSDYFMATDACSSPTLSQHPPAGTWLPLGTNQVVLTALDSAGNSNSFTSFVIVSDLELPLITCPATVTVSADAGHDYATAVDLGSPATSDNCSVAGLTNNAPSPFPAGTNVVTWTVTDAVGNQNSCLQQVIVTPSPDLPHQITSIVRNGDGSFTVNFLGASNLSYAVQISSNLVEWVSIKTNTAAANGTWSYDDFSATNAGMRFYRSARP